MTLQSHLHAVVPGDSTRSSARTDASTTEPAAGSPGPVQPAGAGARRVGHLIREARKRKHWSQDRLNDHIRRVAVLHAKPAASQESLKVMISRWENGKKIPDQYSRRLLSLALDVAPETLGLPLDPLDDW